MKTSTASQPKNTTIQISIIAGLFFTFGFVTWINGALIPFMKSINELSHARAYLVATASYISFVVMAIPSSILLRRISYKKGMALGLFIMALGALLFIPAAKEREYWIFLTGIFIQGSGMTLLQTAANPYITILGPIESGAKRIAIMGICNKVAGALGSLIFGSLLLSGMKEMSEKLETIDPSQKNALLDAAANNVIFPYIIMSVILILLAILINFAPLPDIDISQNETSEQEKKGSIFHFPHLWLGMLALFVYVGAEVIAGDSIVSYGLSLGFEPSTAKFFPTLTLMSMVATYSLGIALIPKKISQENALKISALLGIFFTIGILLTTGLTSILFVAALGIANALVWPAIWPLTLKGLGKFTQTASALLVMSIAGGAIIPPFYGNMVDRTKITLIGEGVNEVEALSKASTSSYWVLLFCYAIIFFYAIKGYKLKYKKGA